MGKGTKLSLTSLELDKFSSYEHATILFPKTGVVLLEGKNGVGKSSILEGFVVAGWGRPLRAGPREWVPLKTNGYVSATIEKNDEVIEIKRLGSSKTAPNNPILGSVSIFTNGNVFSRHTLAKFTVATNTERKRLIEEILGLEDLEKAAVKSRQDLANQTSSIRHYQEVLSILNIKITERKEEIKRLKDSKGKDIPSLSPIIKNRERVITQETKLESRNKAVLGRLAVAKQAAHSLSRMKVGDPCSICGRKIPRELLDKMTAVSRMEDITALETELNSIRKDLGTTREKRISLGAQIGIIQQQIEQANRQQVIIDDLASKLEALKKDQAKNQKIVTQQEEDLPYMEGVVEIFGPHGVRSQILEGALELLNEEVNDILAPFGGSFSVSIKPFREGKQGPINDVSIEVEQAGGGSYLGCSEGERKRIDLAVMLGLGKLGSFTSSNENQFCFYFFDDVFDILDDEGVLGFCEYAFELAKTNLVVVMTHDPRVRTSFPSARIYQCKKENGVSTIKVTT